MLKYMYIDESGDLGIKGSKYLIISCVIVDNPKKLNRIIKNMKRYKFKKQIKKTNEIKATKSKKKVIKHMLQKFNELEGTHTHMIVLEKGKLFSQYLKTNKHKLYNYVAGKLTQKIIINQGNLEIRIDKSKSKLFLRQDFNEYFETKLRENCQIRDINIYHSHSHAWTGLQFADIMAWSCFQKFEHNNNEFLDIINPEKRDIFHTF